MWVATCSMQAMLITCKMTHIRMSPNLLNSLVIEMARVAQQPASDVVGVLQALEYISRDRVLGALSQLRPLVLAGQMEILNPIMMRSGIGVLYVLLEHDHI